MTCLNHTVAVELLYVEPKKNVFPTHQVLDAPQLQDDFYLNLVDWSSLNVLAVGLGACVYLWSACTSKVRGWRVHVYMPLRHMVPIYIFCRRDTASPCSTHLFVDVRGFWSEAAAAAV